MITLEQEIISSYPKNFAPLFTYKRDGLLVTGDRLINYLELGLLQEDIPKLSELVFDNDIELMEYGDEIEGLKFAPIHAIIALGQLQASDIAQKLLNALDTYIDDDYYDWALTRYFRDIDPKKFTMLESYFHDESHDPLTRMSALEIIEKMGKKQLQLHEKIEALLLKYLQEDCSDHDGLNAFVLSMLKSYGGVKHIDIIQKSFATKSIDIFFDGDLEDFEIDLGIRDKRETPRQKNKFQMMADMMQRHRDDTESIPYIANEKIGRNDPCPCGSGKKYKRCCLKT